MKKSLLFILTIALTFNMMATNIWDGTSEPWTQGDGTMDNPYCIEMAAHLAYLAEKVNEGYQSSGQGVFEGQYFLLTDDLDLNNLNWTPIGNVDYSMNGFYFAGYFDGGYHQIENLRVQTSADLVGLFAAVGGYGACVCNLSVSGAIISTGMGASGVVGGIANDAQIRRCSFSGSVNVNNSGSFCGAAGVVAGVQNGIVHECSSTASIMVNNSNFMGAAVAGGVVCFARGYTLINKCYNTGSISANALLMGVSGGILGATVDLATVEVGSCYNVGQVSGGTSGGIFGMVSPIDPSKVENAENTIEIDNCFFLNTAGGNNGYGTGMTSDEMKTEEFKDQIDQRTHSFVMDNGTNNGYPIHGLTDFVLFEASDITSHSAKLSGWVHQGNEHLAMTGFFYYSFDELDEGWVDVPSDGYVEVILEGLREETDYLFSLFLVFDDDSYLDCETKSFTTGYDAVGALAQQAIVYPNPVSETLYIQGIESAEVQVFNALGQKVKTIENANEINVSDLTEGIYLLRITTAKGKVFERKVSVK